MWFFEHPGKSIAARRAILWVIMLYGGSFLLLRLSERLPAEPEILHKAGSSLDMAPKDFYLPCYLVENLISRFL